MSASLAGLGISSARVTFPRWGAGHADRVLLAGDSVLTPGARAMLLLGTASYTGTVRPGAAFGGEAAYSWIAGAGMWSTTVAPQPYHDDAGVMLSAVLRDLAADAGEIGVSLDIPDRSLGRDWTRPAAPASDLLDALSGREWWIAADGVTHVGPRATTPVAPAGLSVDPYEPELRRATVELGDDDIAPLVPGIILTADGLPAPLSVGSVVVEVDAARLTVTLWGEAMGAELFARIVDHLTAWRRFLQLAPYTVVSVGADGRVVVQPADARASALPDAPALSLVFGVPGASATLQTGSPGLVAWVAGDPGSPVVAMYPAGTLPVAVGLSASGTATLGGAAGAGMPPAIAAYVDANFTALNTKLLSKQDGVGTNAALVPTAAMVARVV